MMSVDRAFANLSERERQVLRLIGGCYSNRVIAEKLDLQPRTIETHVANIRQALGIQWHGRFNARALLVRISDRFCEYEKRPENFTGNVVPFENTDIA